METELIGAAEAAAIVNYSPSTWKYKLAYSADAIRIAPPVQRKRGCKRSWKRDQVCELRDYWQARAA